MDHRGEIYRVKCTEAVVRCHIFSRNFDSVKNCKNGYGKLKYAYEWSIPGMEQYGLLVQLMLLPSDNDGLPVLCLG